MLPNLKFMVCGILFCILLFVAAGAGVMLPDARTRIGEMPEIGRPIMQRSMAEAPASVQQVYMMAAARHGDELERPREPAPADMTPVPGPPEPDGVKPDLSNPEISKPDLSKPDLPVQDAVSEETSDGARAANPAPAGSPGDARAAPAPASARLPAASAPAAAAAETRTGGRMDEAASLQVVALAVPAAEGREPVRPFANVPLPPPRPAFVRVLRRHVFHRRHRIVQQQDTAVQGVPFDQGVAAASPGLATSPIPSQSSPPRSSPP